MTESEKSAVRDLTYMRFRVLINHDAMCLQIGDRIESRTQPGRWQTVVDVKRFRGRGGESREVHMENGYVFDPVGHPEDQWLRNMEIHRPMMKFRPSAFAAQSAKPDANEGLQIRKEMKTRGTRGKIGSRK